MHKLNDSGESMASNSTTDLEIWERMSKNVDLEAKKVLRKFQTGFLEFLQYFYIKNAINMILTYLIRCHYYRRQNVASSNTKVDQEGLQL